MRNPVSAPTLVPSFDVSVYLVFNDFGEIGRAYREPEETFPILQTSSRGC
jgi:hypothetical protein